MWLVQASNILDLDLDLRMLGCEQVSSTLDQGLDLHKMKLGPLWRLLLSVMKREKHLEFS